jgi:pilus assembly protein CpaB
MISKLLRNKNARLVLLSIILGLIGALLVRAYVNQTVFQQTGGNVVAVVVAADDIPAGSSIRAEQLSVSTIPQAYAQARSVHAANASFLVGQKPSVDLSKGEAIQWTEIQLAPDETLGDRLNVDQRAVTLRVDATGALDGMIQPGDRVDIVCQVRSGKAGMVMHMVAQNMTIIAVGNRLTANTGSVAGKKDESEQNNVSSVTFRASPQEAMLLSYAETQGRIVLLLRNDKDVVTEPEQDVGATDLEGKPAENAAMPGATPEISSGEYPTIYEPGQQPRSGNLPGNIELEEELRKLKPEDAQKRLLQELQKPSPTKP